MCNKKARIKFIKEKKMVYFSAPFGAILFEIENVYIIGKNENCTFFHILEPLIIIGYVKRKYYI